MENKLTEKENFIRKFWLLIAIACSIVGTIYGYLLIPPALLTGFVHATSLVSFALNLFLAYFLTYKKASNFFLTLLLISPLFLLCTLVYGWIAHQDEMLRSYLNIIPQLGGYIALFILTLPMRTINKKLQFVKAAPDAYKECLQEMAGAENHMQLQHISAQWKEKFPKFSLYFKSRAKELSQKPSHSNASACPFLSGKSISRTDNSGQE